MEHHPFSRLFDMLPDSDLRTLADDIKANGQHQPIVVYQGQILDGRNRERACAIAGVEPRAIAYEGDDPAGYVVSLNLHRRHLTESQRAMVGAKLANMRQGERTDLQPSANLRKVSSADAADMVNVSPRSVEGARAVRAAGSPELVAAVERGEIPVSTANKIARAPSLAPLMSSASDEWYTPQHVWRAALGLLGSIDVDPCTTADSPIPAALKFTKEDDGLAHDWNGTVWMNPPYSSIDAWCDKLVSEVAAERCTRFVALVPARTDTKWWAKITMPAPFVYFIRGRLKFSGSENSAPFPSALVLGESGAGDQWDSCGPDIPRDLLPGDLWGAL